MEKKEETKATINDRMREAREKLGMSAKELAIANGVTEERILAWESGEEAFPPDYIECIAESLGLAPIYLLTGQEASGEGLRQQDKIFRNHRSYYVCYALEKYSERVLQSIKGTMDAEFRMALKALLKAMHYTDVINNGDILLRPYTNPLSEIWESFYVFYEKYDAVPDDNNMMEEAKLDIRMILMSLSDNEKNNMFWRATNHFSEEILQRALNFLHYVGWGEYNALDVESGMQKFMKNPKDVSRWTADYPNEYDIREDIMYKKYDLKEFNYNFYEYEHRAADANADVDDYDEDDE